MNAATSSAWVRLNRSSGGYTAPPKYMAGLPPQLRSYSVRCMAACSHSHPMVRRHQAAFSAVTPPPGRTSIRPAQYSRMARMVMAPSGTVGRWPLVSTRVIPSSISASSACRQSGVTSTARWNTASWPPMTSIIRRHLGTSTRPSASSTPNTIPSAPFSRNSAASSSIVSNSVPV